MSNSNKFTPGPWKVLYSSNVYPSVHAGEDNSPICPLYEYVAEGQRDLLDNAEANAQIIAAAPEMLEALERLVFYYETMREKFKLADGYPDPSGIIENLDHKIPHLKAAIAKARGES